MALQINKWLINCSYFHPRIHRCYDFNPAVINRSVRVVGSRVPASGAHPFRDPGLAFLEGPLDRRNDGLGLGSLPFEKRNGNTVVIVDDIKAIRYGVLSVGWLVGCLLVVDS